MIRFENVSNDWGNFKLKDVSLHVREGEYFVVLGPTGAGKTLLLETIAGFYTPRSGRILLRGEDAVWLLPELRGVGFVYQDYSLFPHMTVEENVRFGLEMRKVSAEEMKRRMDDVLMLLGIEKLRDRYPKTLSGGEQQRAAIARALVIEPDILLLDEPLSALDTRTRESLRHELRRIHRTKGTTTIHVTHDQTEALFLADRIAVIIDGELVQVDTPDRVFNKPDSVNVAEFVGVENVLQGVVTGYSRGVASIDCGFEVKAVSEIREGPVYAFIRPENIILSVEPFPSSARNVVECTVMEVVKLGSIHQVKTDRGLNVVVTQQSVEEFELKPGTKEYASFKATAVHVIKRNVQPRPPAVIGK